MLETVMTPAAWTALLVTFAVAVIVPGPDTFLILRLGVRSRRSAVHAAFGISLGNLLWTTASVLGLAALMRALPGVLPVLQIFGSAVLLWLGFQSIRGGVVSLRSRRTASAVAEEQVQVGTIRHPFRLGFITNLSNPKALLFFTALFAQLMPQDATVLDRGLIVLSMSVLGLAWFLLFAWLTSSRGFQRWFSRATPAFDIVAGLVFIAVAAVVLVELGLAFFVLA